MKPRSHIGSRINFAFQTFFLAIGLVALIVHVFQHGFDMDVLTGLGIIIYVAELGIGLWQLVSGLLNLIKFRNKVKRVRRMFVIYWIVVVAYAVAGFAAFIWAENNSAVRVDEVIAIIFASAWLIAIYHYTIVVIQSFGSDRNDPAEGNGDPFYQGQYPRQ